MKAVVLLSAGLDSTVNLYAAQNELKEICAVTFDYGQRAAKSEIFASQNLCKLLKIPHQVIALPFFKVWGGSSLTDEKITVPQGKAVKIDDRATSEITAKAVWVPNRNGIFLNIAAGIAESVGAKYVVPGFNKEEAATFPDNSTDYVSALDKSFWYSTSNHVEVRCFTATKNKTEIAELGNSLKVNWSKIWPCYFSQSEWCRECESCQRSLRALKACGVSV